MEKIYKYQLGKFVIFSSLLYIAAIAWLCHVLDFVYGGGYFSAWLMAMIVAVVILMTLSIPRRAIVDEEGIEIQCITDDTAILHEDIQSIRKVEKREMALCIPIFGAMGFFGHYGRFLNLRTMEIVHIYASRWGKFVEITNIEGHKYYISCEEREDIVKRVEEYMQLHDTQ